MCFFAVASFRRVWAFPPFRPRLDGPRERASQLRLPARSGGHLISIMAAASELSCRGPLCALRTGCGNAPPVDRTGPWDSRKALPRFRPTKLRPLLCALPHETAAIVEDSGAEPGLRFRRPTTGVAAWVRSVGVLPRHRERCSRRLYGGRSEKGRPLFFVRISRFIFQAGFSRGDFGNSASHFASRPTAKKAKADFENRKLLFAAPVWWTGSKRPPPAGCRAYSPTTARSRLVKATLA